LELLWSNINTSDIKTPEHSKKRQPQTETTMRRPHRLLPTFAVNALTAGNSVPMWPDAPTGVAVP
jgi:hypothetical protein